MCIMPFGADKAVETYIIVAAFDNNKETFYDSE